MPLPPDNGFVAGGVARPELLSPSEDPWRAQEERRREARLGAHNGEGVSLALGTRGAGSSAPPAPQGSPRPAAALLTSTMAKRSSSSPGSGIGSFNGTLCALKSVCCESMLPALPMSAACWSPGWLRAPCVRLLNAHSPGRSAPALRRVPVSARRTLLPSRAQNPAGPRPPSCSPPPRRRPGLSASRGVCRALGADQHGAPAALAGARGRLSARSFSSVSRPGRSGADT